MRGGSWTMRIYLDHLSRVDLAAVEFVRVAAKLGCAGVGLYVGPPADNARHHEGRRDVPRRRFPSLLDA